MARALLEAGKDKAKRALEDFTLTDEERAARDAERERETKLGRYKWIAIGIGGLLVVISLFFLLAKLWVYVLLLAVLGAIGFGVYHYVRPRVSAKYDALVDPKEKPELSAKVIDVETVPESRPESRPAGREEPRSKIEQPPRETAAEQEKRIDDELAALKAKVGSK